MKKTNNFPLLVFGFAIFTFVSAQLGAYDSNGAKPSGGEKEETSGAQTSSSNKAGTPDHPIFGDIAKIPANKIQRYHANAYLGLGVPVGGVAEQILPAIGLRATLWRNFLRPWLNPLIISDVSFSKGKEFNGMLFYYVGLGFTHSFQLPKKITVLPFATVGTSGGRLYYQEGFGFFMPAVDVGVSAEYWLSDRWRLASSLSIRHIFDKYVPGTFVQFHVGAGYVF